MSEQTDFISKSLSAYSTCDISDALLKLKHPHGGFLPHIQMFSPSLLDATAKIAGPAYTVRFVPNTDTTSPNLETHYIDTVPASSIIFISSPPNTHNAVYGGLMSTRAKFSQARGTVVDGCIRDLPAHQAIGFPVFARAVSTPAYYEVVRPSQVNVPVEYIFPDGRGGNKVLLRPGDWIVGDANGVVCLPVELVEKVLEILPGQVASDDRMDEEIAKGMTFTEAKRRFRGT